MNLWFRFLALTCAAVIVLVAAPEKFVVAMLALLLWDILFHLGGDE